MKEMRTLSHRGPIIAREEIKDTDTDESLDITHLEYDDTDTNSDQTDEGSELVEVRRELQDGGNQSYVKMIEMTLVSHHGMEGSDTEPIFQDKDAEQTVDIANESAERQIENTAQRKYADNDGTSVREVERKTPQPRFY